ncbi:MAG: cobalamin biosynthesis protein [Lachnospiraceae bacterium]|nr:cobalamin biosynthesis protein [Lachnospiraceae bacterium]
MNISIISFTGRGLLLSQKIKSIRESSENVRLYSAWREFDPAGFEDVTKVGDLGSFARDNFEQKNVLIFIGACGIAVRTIAPFVRDKMSDPAVIVIDEAGQYVIPVLSGHVGGANDLALNLSERLGAQCVITTATDINGKFSVDSFAVKNNMSIANKGQIAAVSSRLLSGQKVKMCVNREDLPEGFELPSDVEIVYYGSLSEPLKEKSSRDFAKNAPDVSKRDYRSDIYKVDDSLMDHIYNVNDRIREDVYKNDNDVISDIYGNEVSEKVDIFIMPSGRNSQLYKKAMESGALILMPRRYVLGIGLKRGKSREEIESFVDSILDEMDISLLEIYAMATIDIKSDEPGLLDFCRKYGLELITYSAGELAEAVGTFSHSDFVEEVTGVDNVCERAAVLGAKEGGELIREKSVYSGMSLAVARMKSVILG